MLFQHFSRLVFVQHESCWLVDSKFHVFVLLSDQSWLVNGDYSLVRIVSHAVKQGAKMVCSQLLHLALPSAHPPCLISAIDLAKSL
jgi:hypothetical protein